MNLILLGPQALEQAREISRGRSFGGVVAAPGRHETFVAVAVDIII